MRIKRVQLAIIILALLVVLFFAPWSVLSVRYRASIYGRIEDVPRAEYGVVFGAYVEPDGTLSDAALERVEGAVLLYQEKRIKKLFISGTNWSNNQADTMAQYAQKRGVAVGDIVVDGLGIDTHDTCRHFAQMTGAGVLVSQGYHLPRAMYMCKRDGVVVNGLAVNHLGILAERGSNRLAVYGTRVSRLVRESVLVWSYMLGIYDRISNEAEVVEQVSRITFCVSRYYHLLEVS